MVSTVSEVTADWLRPVVSQFIQRSSVRLPAVTDNWVHSAGSRHTTDSSMIIITTCAYGSASAKALISINELVLC